jgi:hypothetical protein
MSAYRQALQDPTIYHGHQRRATFFEGWYFKLVDATGQHRYAVIPGIFKHQTPADSHAFIQVLDGVTGQAAYHRFPVEAFHAAEDRFEVTIGPNGFQADRLHLELASPGQQICADLQFSGCIPWPVTWRSIGAMGWFGYLPFLECNHGVVSVDHSITGQWTVNGQAISMEGGRGYIEKDWGSSFPSGYVWTQCNHFGQTGISLMSSIAMIPRLGLPFRGFICGLYWGGQLYRFATYTGARLQQLRLTDTDVSWRYRGRTGEGAARGLYQLSIHAKRSTGGLLKAPYDGAMRERVMESLTATLEVRLSRLEKGQETLLWQDSGQYAGLEVAGDLSPLLDENLTTSPAS